MCHKDDCATELRLALEKSSIQRVRPRRGPGPLGEAWRSLAAEGETFGVGGGAGGSAGGGTARTTARRDDDEEEGANIGKEEEEEGGKRRKDVGGRGERGG